MSKSLLLVVLLRVNRRRIWSESRIHNLCSPSMETKSFTSISILLLLAKWVDFTDSNLIKQTHVDLFSGYHLTESQIPELALLQKKLFVSTLFEKVFDDQFKINCKCIIYTRILSEDTITFLTSVFGYV